MKPGPCSVSRFALPPRAMSELGARALTEGEILEAEGLLFDMDGTLVNSIHAIERVWGEWATGHGMQLLDVLRAFHGTRAIDAMKQVLPPGADLQAEAKALWRQECAATDVFAVPGVKALLDSLPLQRWALVTSADAELMRCRMRYAGLPLPEVIVTADDVEHGKPDPEPYLRGAAGLGLEPTACLVFEDAKAGLASAAAAGSRAVAITTTFKPEALPAEIPWLADFTRLELLPPSAEAPVRLLVRLGAVDLLKPARHRRVGLRELLIGDAIGRHQVQRVAHRADQDRDLGEEALQL